MDDSYLVLFNPDTSDPRSDLAALAANLAKRGMRLRHASSTTHIFASKQTPVMRLPQGALAVGRLFQKNGRAVDGASVPAELAPDKLRGHVLDNCWGEYVFLQPESSGGPALTVMRDPSGSVGCVYSFQNGGWFVTSDISLARELGLYRQHVDWDFITYFVAHPNHKTRRTALTDVYELLPGCSVCLRGHHATTRTEWSPWSFVEPAKRFADDAAAAGAIEASVSTAVSALAYEDETTVLELSGGLDSSIVAACLQRTSTHVDCFNLSTPIPGADERHYATRVADHLGLELETGVLPIEVARFDFAPPPQSVGPCLTALQYATDAAMQSVGDEKLSDSFFSGAGGDTVFCYLSTAAPAADAFRAHGMASGITALKDLAELHQCTIWKASRLTLRKLLRSPPPPSKANRLFLAPSVVVEASEAHPWFAGPDDALPGDRERIIGLAGTQLFRDAVPRSRTRAVRMPLLAQPVVETCLRVPTWMWMRGGHNRAVARTAFMHRLPAEIIDRRSKGSFIGYSGAVFERNMPGMRAFLLEGHLQERGLLDATALRAVFDDTQRAYSNAMQRVFDLCMVENWVRHQA
ncbi:asparagine synthase-related protein [Luteimonas sp. WGS1318]|uniref:asparagine synthase-related protein n=1 Tax=Luteimonas sp. WGS1318 TaxID=3366815 RepID=UPI00372D1D52